MPVPPAEYLSAADDFLERLERDRMLSREEMEAVRKDLVRSTREEGERALKGMKTAVVGRTRILLPTSENLERARIAGERVRERFSRFRLQWLDKDAVRRQITENVEVSAANKKNFFRHSRRLARNARLFLERVRELEPDLAEEVDATLRQIDDAGQDLLKLEVRSFTTMQENLTRAVNGRMRRSEALEQVRTFDLDRNLWNLSLLAHPEAVVRDMMGASAERMAARVSETTSQVQKRALVFVGAGPDAVSRMTPQSRTASVMWRMFSAEQLGARFAALNAARQSASSWRGLGVGPNTPEFYVPIPPEVEDEVRDDMRARREAFRRTTGS